jgi:hypothetical protein
VTCTGGDYAIVNCLDFPSLTSPSIQLGVPSLVGAAALLVGGRDPRGGKFIMKRRGSGAKRKTEPDPRSFRVTTPGGYPSLLWSGLSTPWSHFKASRGRVGAPRVWRIRKGHTLRQPYFRSAFRKICYASDASVAKLVTFSSAFGFSTAS